MNSKKLRTATAKWHRKRPIACLPRNKTKGFLSNRDLKSNWFGGKIFVISLSDHQNPELSGYINVFLTLRDENFEIWWTYFEGNKIHDIAGRDLDGIMF